MKRESRAWCLAVGIWVVALVPAGCGRGLESIDRSIEKLTAKGSKATGSSLPTERAADRDVTRAEVRKARSTSPGTTNPGAESLTFEVAAPTRDVAGRLSEYAAAAGVTAGEAGREIGVREALRISQKSAREFLSAQEQYILAAIALLIERHQWGPRLFNDTTVSLGGSGDDGDFTHAADVVNTLRATQRLPGGGSVEARWVWAATEQLRETASGRYTQSSAIILSGEVPLLRGAGAVARESLIQAERDLIYAARDFERFRREFLVDIARDYVELQNTRSSIANQERQLLSLRDNAKRTSARVTAGRIEAFEQGIADNEVLSAEASLASQREQYILQLERFKIRLGLSPTEIVRVTDEALDVPEPQIDLDTAATLALDYRLDLQNQRDRLEDARREVSNTRNALLPQLDVEGSVNIPTDDDERVGGLSPSPDDLRYEVSATLGLPLDRRVERLRHRSAIISMERATREFDRARDEAVVSVRSALRRVDLARFQLRLAEQQVEINRKRRRGQELRADTIDTQVLLDSENALLAAENQRDRAQANLRIAVLNYLLESDQLRVSRDGTLERLPGMGEGG